MTTVPIQRIVERQLGRAERGEILARDIHTPRSQLTMLMPSDAKHREVLDRFGCGLVRNPPRIKSRR